MCSGAKKYLVSHQLCKFSHLKRWERPVIFIIGTLQLWETKWEKKKSSKSHLIFKEFICKLWWKISIWSITKVHLIPFVGNDRGQTFSVSLHRVLTHCCWYFGPFLHAHLLWSSDVLGLSLGNTDFQLPPKIFYGVENWRLARIWDHCHAERPSHMSSSMPLMMEGGCHSKCQVEFLPVL